MSRRHIHRSRPRLVDRSFVTVLFGKSEFLKLQPILFRQQQIEDGERIHVIDSPADSEKASRKSVE